MSMGNELYRCLLENAADSVTIRTLEGWIIEANPAACELLGYTYDELLTKNFMDLIPSEYHNRFSTIREALGRDGSVDYESFFVRGDGSRFRGEARCVVIESDGHNVIMCINRDVSKHENLELALNDTREKYQLIVETASEGIMAADNMQRINYVNQKIVDVLGYNVEEFIGRILSEFIYEDDLADYDMRVENRKNNIAERFERRFVHKDGSVRWMIVSVTPLMSEGKFVGSFAMLTDITDMKLAELAWRDSELKYRLVVETAAEAIILLDNTGVMVDVNNKVLEIFKLNRSVVVGQNLFDFLPNFGINVREAFKIFMDDLNGINQGEDRVWTGMVNGVESHFIAHTSNIIQDGIVKGMSMILEDVTDLLNTEVKLKSSLREKNVLLKEIHHRVKNNLQIISSLLNLQSRNIVNEHDQKIFLDSQTRIKSMAIVHEQLYQSEDLSSINIENYIKSLVNSLFKSFNINPNSINFNCNVENIKFGVNTAIPLGLMINEFLTNILKHAFPCVQEGPVSLTDQVSVLSRDAIMGDYCSITLNLTLEEGKYILMIADNGVGLPENLNYKETSTLGFQLINSLVNQLDGVIRLDRSRGTEFIIEFTG